MSTAIKFLKAGKAPGEDDIQLKMLKAMNNFGVHWPIYVFHIAWKTGEVLKQSQTSELIPIHKIGDKKKCTAYRGISLSSLFGKIYAKGFEKKCCEIVKPQL